MCPEARLENVRGRRDIDLGGLDRILKAIRETILRRKVEHGIHGLKERIDGA